MSLEFRARQQDLIAQINELIFYTYAGFFFFFSSPATRRLELRRKSSKLRKEGKENGERMGEK